MMGQLGWGVAGKSNPDPPLHTQRQQKFARKDEYRERVGKGRWPRKMAETVVHKACIWSTGEGLPLFPVERGECRRPVFFG